MTFDMLCSSWHKMNNRPIFISPAIKLLEENRKYFVKVLVRLGKEFLNQLPKWKFNVELFANVIP